MNDMVSSHGPHRITVDEYRRMDEAGVFTPGSRIELIEGELIERLLPMNPPHANALSLLARHLTIHLGDRAFLRVQVPITLGDLSEAQPDVSIVTMPPEQFDVRHPTSSDIYAAIEVADSSRRADLARKVPLYAAFAIPETWVVDLIDSCIRIFREPRDGEYRDVTIAHLGDNVSLLAFPDLEMSAASMFVRLP